MHHRTIVAASLCFAILASGCSLGNAPAGMDATDAKEAIGKMGPEDKIRFIASSPLPGPEKEKKYKEIEAETGVKASDVLKGQAQVPGAGATAPR